MNPANIDLGAILGIIAICLFAFDKIFKNKSEIDKLSTTSNMS